MAAPERRVIDCGGFPAASGSTPTRPRSRSGGCPAGPGAVPLNPVPVTAPAKAPAGAGKRETFSCWNRTARARVSSPSHEPASPDAAAVELSIIAPARNEEANLRGLIDDVERALAASGIPFELIVVDDASTDRSLEVLREQAPAHPWLRPRAMAGTPPAGRHGQSAVFHAGIREARGALVAMLDADRQNDPADLPRMVERLRAGDCDLVQGDRSAQRRDNAVRRFSSRVGRWFRRLVLGDTIRDTGCSIRVMRREVALALPLQYRGVHRFIPAYARRLGYRVDEMPVNHRPRAAGRSNYGIWNRALPGLVDLLAVRWMFSRLTPVGSRPLDGTPERDR